MESCRSVWTYLDVSFSTFTMARTESRGSVKSFQAREKDVLEWVGAMWVRRNGSILTVLKVKLSELVDVLDVEYKNEKVVKKNAKILPPINEIIKFPFSGLEKISRSTG